MSEALEAILGESAKGLSATNISRLTKIWEQEYKQWQNQDLSDKEYIYFWVDGIYFNVRLNRPSLLTRDYRSSCQWEERSRDDS